ncbi:VWA domain-containing protein [Paenibacillus wynnii]|uniref:VWA domain-containing protein n=1 Tax=Paenibacillus wynnii TaxID=268407 RepID=UPI00278E043F|nr:VWA domain-containing protein [Paenibacillus wynnii]MDQ0194139.1 hypothetical protein [Paenibacillus wynnii]
MYCTNCGANTQPDDQFCVSCGQNLKGGQEEIQPVEKGAEFKKTKPPYMWIWVAVVSLILLGGAGYWFIEINNQTLAQPPSSSTNSSSLEEETEQPISPESTEKAKEVTENTPSPAAAEPVYIRVNQVDSANYEQGKVDVYFSLFSDQAYEHEIESKSLTKEMFKVNQLPVSAVNQVENVDTVSVNLVIDKSGSMTEPPSSTVSQSKMDMVRRAAVEFLKNVPPAAKGQFEVLSFSTYAPPVPDIAFTSDRNFVGTYLESLESDNGQTALYDSLTKALYDTNMMNGPKYIIAFTDGQDSNYGSSAQSVIDLSKQLGIPIYCIGFGEMGTELQMISEETGGQYFAISIDDNLQQELELIYAKVFQRYVKQYKITYTPQQKIKPGGDFSVAINMESTEQKAQTEALTFTRKMDTASINVLNGLFEYQVNYANAVNNLDFSIVSDNVNNGSPFYKNLKNRIEVDYVNAMNQGNQKIIDTLKNYRVESVNPQADGSYKIVFFKFFPLLLNNENVFEADLNTYTLTQNKVSNKWQISEFGRKECSIYRNESDPGSLCTENAVDTLYSGNPWPAN